MRKVEDSRPARQPARPVVLAAPTGPTGPSAYFLRDWEACNTRLAQVRSQIADRYDALLIVGGGSGLIVDLANNWRVHDPDPRLPRPGPAHRRRVLRRRLPRLRPRPGDPRVPDPRQARHRALHRVRLQGRHRVHRHRLRDGAAAVLRLELHPARRHRTRRCLPRELRQGDLVIDRLPVHHGPFDARLLPDRTEDRRGPRTGACGSGGSGRPPDPGDRPTLLRPDER
ncbi:hypothetical protein ACRAWF_01990 [Streptomyces sp. L7]